MYGGSPLAFFAAVGVGAGAGEGSGAGRVVGCALGDEEAVVDGTAAGDADPFGLGDAEPGAATCVGLVEGSGDVWVPALAEERGVAEGALLGAGTVVVVDGVAAPAVLRA